MKIFIDTASKWNSGFETHIKQFLLNFDKLSVNDEIIIYGHRSLISKFNQFSNKITFVVDNNIPENTFKAFNWRKKYIPKLIEYYSPDIHFNLMGWMHHRKKNIIRIGMNRNLQPFINENINILKIFIKEHFRLLFYKKAILESYNNCNGVIFNSDYAAEIIRPYLSQTIKTTIIHHGVNEIFFSTPRNETKTNDLSILYISDFYPYKNHDVLIKAVHYIRRKHKKNINLNLIGEMNKKAEKRINHILKFINNYEEWLKFYHKVPNEELKKHFLSNNIFVFASSVESFGHTLIEAMAAGMPIVCSNKRPMKDFIGKGALLVDEKNEYDMAEKILTFINDSGLRNKMANIAFKYAQNFSYRKMTEETIEFLHSFQ